MTFPASGAQLSDTQHPLVAAAPGRRGFTAIELLIVLSIAMLLAAMAAPSILTSVRRSKVQQTAAQVLEAANQARRLARATPPATDGRMIGIRITQDGPGTGIQLELVRGTQASDATPMKGPDDQPVLDITLDTSAIIYLADKPLFEDGQKVTWFYTPQTGFPMRQTSDASPCTVGGRQVTITSQWGIAQPWSSAVVPAVAPEGSGQPGFSIRSPDDRYRRSILIYPTGLVYEKDF